MADIRHDFPIFAPLPKVFDAFATPAGLNQWWTLEASGTPKVGETYRLFFGESYDWRGVVRRYEPGRVIEWELTAAMPDWVGSRVGAEFSEKDGATQVRFYHTGWPVVSEHFRVSSFCWAMYLRILKRHVEHGEVVQYEKRLDA